MFYLTEIQTTNTLQVKKKYTSRPNPLRPAVFDLWCLVPFLTTSKIKSFCMSNNPCVWKSIMYQILSWTHKDQTYNVPTISKFTTWRGRQRYKRKQFSTSWQMPCFRFCNEGTLSQCGISTMRIRVATQQMLRQNICWANEWMRNMRFWGQRGGWRYRLTVKAGSVSQKNRLHEFAKKCKLNSSHANF